MIYIGDIPRKGATNYPHREAVVFEDTRLTYAELNERVNRFAHTLSNKGYKKGDRLTILSENTHKYLEIYFAAAKIGMCVTPLNFRLSDAEIEFIVVDCEANCFIVGSGYEDRVSAMKHKLSNIRDWIALDKDLDGFDFYEDLIQNESAVEPNIELDENDMIVLMYTGGTTGLPKGVMMSNRGLMTAFLSFALNLEFTSKDTTCFVLPLFHVSFWSAMSVLLTGGKVVILRRPEIAEIANLISREKCTHINAVPTLYGWLLQMPGIDDYDFSNIRSMSYAGSPMPREVLIKCIEKFGNVFEQAYGSTEVLPLTFLSAEDHVLEGDRSKLLLSAGKESYSNDVRVVDKNDVPVGTGKIGEIVARGKNVMMGYWKNPELTAQTVCDGWHHMGDMGYIDAEGYLFLVDRKADMIITGGENVYPKETEDVLYEHPAVMECAVVSKPDEKWGELVHAAVVCVAGASATEEELIAHCKSKLAGYKCPKSIEFMNELPKSPVGKILRKDVRAPFWQNKVRSIG